MTEDDPLIGAHEVPVADLIQDGSEFVAVVSGVQVGPADAAAQDLEQHLPALGLRGRQVGDLELGGSARDGSHAVTFSSNAAAAP